MNFGPSSRAFRRVWETNNTLRGHSVRASLIPPWSVGSFSGLGHSVSRLGPWVPFPRIES